MTSGNAARGRLRATLNERMEGDLRRRLETLEQEIPDADARLRMLHGSSDPHPGGMIRDSLAPHLARFEYVEWGRCGHYPWAERAVREEFLAMLRKWLSLHLRGQT